MAFQHNLISYCFGNQVRATLRSKPLLLLPFFSVVGERWGLEFRKARTVRKRHWSRFFTFLIVRLLSCTYTPTCTRSTLVQAGLDIKISFFSFIKSKILYLSVQNPKFLPFKKEKQRTKDPPSHQPFWCINPIPNLHLFDLISRCRVRNTYTYTYTYCFSPLLSSPLLSSPLNRKPELDGKQSAARTSNTSVGRTRLW